MPFRTNPFLDRLGPTKLRGFDVLHRDAAVAALKAGRIRCTGEFLAAGERTVGDPAFLRRRQRQPMPEGFLGMVSAYTPLSIPPATRSAYAASTGYNTPAIPRSELVVIAIDIGGLSRYGLRPLATDRSPLAAGCMVSDDLQFLDAVPWDKVRGRSLKKDGDHSRGYDAEVLVWSSVPLAGVAELVCPDGESRRHMEMTVQECGIEITVFEDAAAFF